MNLFKLLLVFTLLLFGTFAQRFLRHSNNDVALIDGKNSGDNLLSSDGLNAQEFGDDVKLTGYAKEIELELKYNELMFEYCSKRISQNELACMNQPVYACYDAENPDADLRGDCGPNQCYILFLASRLDNDKDICSTAIPSCKPLITNGKIKLSVKAATTECFLTVKNAKIWIPTTTPAPTSPPPAIPSSPADEGENLWDKAGDYFCAYISWC